MRCTVHCFVPQSQIVSQEEKSLKPTPLIGISCMQHYFSPLLITMWVIQMSQVVFYQPFQCIMKDLSSGNKIFKEKSQHSPYFSTGKMFCWFQEVNGKLGFKNNRKQLQAQILTNSKYFIKNNSITPSVEKGKVIDCRKSNVTLANYYYSWQEKLPTRLTRIVSHQWFSKCSLLLHQEKRSTENTGNPNSGF